VRIVLAGASGFLGRPLHARLREHGHEVIRLVRREPSAPDERFWDPAGGRLNNATLDGADAAVCLSGAGVGDHRWTASYKRTILASRVDSAATMARAVTAAGTPVLVCASAVGYYGDTGDSFANESAPPGTGFLADVCVQWEAAAQPAVDAGVRVAHLRTGLPLSRSGGLLHRVVPLARLGVAGRLGSGRQFMPWISLADAIDAMRFVIESDLRGPINVVGPDPARNADFMGTLGRLLHRPTVLPAPTFGVRALLGEFAGDVLGGQRAIPTALAAAGFAFRHQTLDEALRWALADHPVAA
jgi:uncharacterized protein (TIGR01777 family)